MMTPVARYKHGWRARSEPFPIRKSKQGCGSSKSASNVTETPEILRDWLSQGVLYWFNEILHRNLVSNPASLHRPTRQTYRPTLRTRQTGSDHIYGLFAGLVDGTLRRGAVKFILARRFRAGMHPTPAPPQRTHVTSLQHAKALSRSSR